MRAAPLGQASVTVREAPRSEVPPPAIPARGTSVCWTGEFYLIAPSLFEASAPVLFWLFNLLFAHTIKFMPLNAERLQLVRLDKPGLLPSVDQGDRSRRKNKKLKDLKVICMNAISKMEESAVRCMLLFLSFK